MKRRDFLKQSAAGAAISMSSHVARSTRAAAEKWFVVDTHNQHIPREAVQKSRGGITDLTDIENPRIAPFRRILDLEGKLRAMDDAGVDMALLHNASTNYLGLEFCKAMNDGNARVMREYPKRFICCAHIPLDDGGSPAALQEVDRAITGLGLRAVALETSTDKTVLGSDELTPLFDKINRLNVPVVIHPATKLVPGSGLKHTMHGSINVEIENTKACVEVMFGILPKFPELKFIMPHHGGALPIWQGRMMNSFVPEGWPVPDNLKSEPKTPRVRKLLGLDKAWTEIFNKLYFDTSGFQGWMPITLSALYTVRPDRFCFGTDQGFEMVAAQDIKGFIEDIKKLNLPEKDRRNILGENIRTLFNLSA